MQVNTELEITNVLLVEDDVQLAGLVQEYLHRSEFEVSLEHRGDTAATAVPTTITRWHSPPI
ncbi:MAG: hypothetical protein ABW127_12770 [Candidatus Thiodiazotropha endolucinida]